jgi:pimeloyl-ACP methyl ester carboxylesterase
MSNLPHFTRTAERVKIAVEVVGKFCSFPALQILIFYLGTLGITCWPGSGPMDAVISTDGTNIAFRRSGDGPPLVLVHGSTADHTRWANVLPELEKRFTVIAMDRRGRGESGDADAYSLEQEYDDVLAVVKAAGTGVSLLGHSFGALCAMEAALRVEGLRRLILYEPPFPVGDKPLYRSDVPDQLEALLAEGDRETFLTVFFSKVAGVSDEQIAALRVDPSWNGRLAAAHTALREMADGDYHFDPIRFRKLDVPTLLLLGENSPAELTAPTHEVHAALPNSRIVVLEGQGHVAMTSAPALLLREVIAFLAD